MKSNVLFTKYANRMNKECPHEYYPRPQLERDSYICLNGEWDFEIRGKNGDAEYSGKILVPFAPESALSGVGRIIGADELMHYHRTVKLPEGFKKNKVLLHFGAIDQEATVYVGGEQVGERLGGYIPFSFDITDKIKNDEVDITVICRDSLDIKYPYGKQTKKRGGMWYTPVSGIWQTVWLESVPEEYIEAVRFTPIEGGVRLSVVGGRVKKTVKITELDRVIDIDGCEVDIIPDTPRLWTPETPYLYHVEISCGEDTVRSYFAIREIGIKEVDGCKRITLNGEPYVFNGLLDQGYYPDGLFMPATAEGYLDDIRLAKRLGFNMLRKHIKIEPDMFYYLCDVEGIAVFQDMVNNSTYSFIHDTALPTIGIQRLKDERWHKDPESRRIFESTMNETVALLYNHPSILYYTVFNEGWGQFSADEMYKKIKALDPTRIIDTTSGWFRRTESDVDSRHIYFKALKPKKLDGRPLVISEFGGYSYRVDGHLFGDGNYGYKRFDNRDEFEAAIAGLYESEVLPLVREGASAFVYTQVSDVEDETNGLISYDREVVKVGSERFVAAVSACSGKI